MLTSTFSNSLIQLLLGLVLIFGCIDEKIVRWRGEDLLEEKSGWYIKYGVRKSHLSLEKPGSSAGLTVPKVQNRRWLWRLLQSTQQQLKRLGEPSIRFRAKTTGSKPVFALGTSAPGLCPDSHDPLQARGLGIKSKQPPEECPSGDVNQRCGQRNKSTLCTPLRKMQLFLSCDGWFWSGLPGFLTSRNLATGKVHKSLQKQ